MKIEGTEARLELTQEVIFDICFTYPIVLAAGSHIFGSEFKTNSLNYRDALPHLRPATASHRL